MPPRHSGTLCSQDLAIVKQKGESRCFTQKLASSIGQTGTICAFPEVANNSAATSQLSENAVRGTTRSQDGFHSDGQEGSLGALPFEHYKEHPAWHPYLSTAHPTAQNSMTGRGGDKSSCACMGHSCPQSVPNCWVSSDSSEAVEDGGRGLWGPPPRPRLCEGPGAPCPSSGSHFLPGGSNGLCPASLRRFLRWHDTMHVKRPEARDHPAAGSCPTTTPLEPPVSPDTLATEPRIHCSSHLPCLSLGLEMTCLLGSLEQGM